MAKGRFTIAVISSNHEDGMPASMAKGAACLSCCKNINYPLQRLAGTANASINKDCEIIRLRV